MIGLQQSESRGATLIEMLVGFFLIAIVLNLCATTFVRANRLATLTTARLLQGQALLEFGRDATRTIHCATRVVTEIGAFRTGPRQLVLETSAGFSVVGVAGDKLACWRIVERDGAYQIDDMDAYPVHFDDLTIALDAAEPSAARCATIHVIPVRGSNAEVLPAEHVIVAALRAQGKMP